MLQYVQEIAVGVHFIVWRRSPILKGALYVRSGVLDGAKNLSLRAGTRNASWEILQALGTNTHKLAESFSCVSHVGDVNACRYFEHKLSGEFFSYSFPMKWRFPS